MNASKGDEDQVFRGVHDMGGLPAGPVDRTEHQKTLFDQRVDAMMVLMNSRRKVFTVDAMRRAIEAIPPADYDRMGYYEKWLEALRALLIETGTIGADELAEKCAEVTRRRAG